MIDERSMSKPRELHIMQGEEGTKPKGQSARESDECSCRYCRGYDKQYSAFPAIRTTCKRVNSGSPNAVVHGDKHSKKLPTEEDV